MCSWKYFYGYSPSSKFFFSFFDKWFVFWFNILVNNLSVMSGRNHRFLNVNIYYGERKVHRAAKIGNNAFSYMPKAGDRVRFKIINAM